MAGDLIVACSSAAKERIVEIMRISDSIRSIAETGFIQSGDEIRMMRGDESIVFGRSGSIVYAKASSRRGNLPEQRYEFSHLPARRTEDPRDVATGLSDDLVARIDSAYANRRGDDELTRRLPALWALLSVAAKAAGKEDHEGYLVMPHRGESLRMVAQKGRRAVELHGDATTVIADGMGEVELCQVVARDSQVSVFFQEMIDERALTGDLPTAMREMQRLNISDEQLVLVRTTPVET